MTELEYDASGLLCPLPVLRANRKLRELPVGGLLTVRATDPAAEQDFPAYCKQTGHELVSSRREGDTLIFVIRKNPPQELEKCPRRPSRRSMPSTWPASACWCASTSTCR